MMFFVSYYFIFGPKIIPEVRARSFWLTLYIIVMIMIAW